MRDPTREAERAAEQVHELATVVADVAKRVAAYPGLVEALRDAAWRMTGIYEPDAVQSLIDALSAAGEDVADLRAALAAEVAAAALAAAGEEVER